MSEINLTESNTTASDNQQSKFKPAERDQIAESLLEELQNAQKFPSTVECDRRPQSPNLTGSKLVDTCGIELNKKFEEVHRSTMKILNNNGGSIGSGFYACLPDDKEICGVVTNYHVARLGPADKTVYLLQDEESPSTKPSSEPEDYYSEGKVVVKDHQNDLALIEVDKTTTVSGSAGPVELKPVEFGKVAAGDSVFMSCYPTLNLKDAFVNSGKVLYTDRQVSVDNGLPMLSPPSIVTDQRSIGGCSGGGNFNAEGKLIGVNRATGSDGAVTIKTEHVIALLEEYKKKKAKQTVK